MYCNKCGSKIEEGSSTCPVCGAQIQEKVSFDWSGVSPGKPVKDNNDVSSPWQDGAYAGSPEFADVLKREMAEKQKKSDEFERQVTEKEPEPQDFSLFEQPNNTTNEPHIENELADILNGKSSDNTSELDYDDTSELPFYSENSIFSNDTSSLDMDDDDDFFVEGDESPRDAAFDPFVDIDDSGRYRVPGEGEKAPFLPIQIADGIDEDEYENAKNKLKQSTEEIEAEETMGESQDISLIRAQKAQELAEAEAEKVAQETNYSGNLDETKNDIKELKTKLAQLMEQDNTANVSTQSDAVAISDLEKQIFSTETIEDAETKKIDKFYTLYRKNEEFQRLLDEEYEKLQQEELERRQGIPQEDARIKAQKEAEALSARQNHDEIVAAQEEARRREQLLEQQRQEELMRQRQREMEIARQREQELAKQRAAQLNDDMDPYKDFSDLTPEKKKGKEKLPGKNKGCRKIFSVLGVMFGVTVFLIVVGVAIAIFSPNSTLGAVLSKWYEIFTSFIS